MWNPSISRLLFRGSFPLLLLLPVLGLVACGDAAEETGGDTAAGYDPAAHACEHVSEAGTAVQAADTLEDDASAVIEVGEEPWSISVSAGGATYVQFEVDEPLEALLFLDTEDVLQTVYHGSDEHAPATPSAVEDCPDDLPEHYHLDLHEAGTWHLEFGPSAAEAIWVMLLTAEGHEEHH